MLSALLPRFANLYELDLSKNEVSDKGVHYLATRALSPDFLDPAWAGEWVCRVASLNLAENKVRDTGEDTYTHSLSPSLSLSDTHLHTYTLTYTHLHLHLLNLPR